MASSGGLTAINAFQAEDEIFVCHVPGVLVLPKQYPAQPELLGKCRGEGPTRKASAREWVLGPRGCEFTRPSPQMLQAIAGAGTLRVKPRAIFGGRQLAAPRNILNV